ncbi:heptaprenyl diphosphate synthase component 1 [Salibacterium halotolerans]|uniref:Heptaprenyl diphosphate synthase (HEPPP synthase) subunit 1 n=1 Tax=Salibacterium halotolerans TaxID=1884432 RepID=A0A1I5Q539_9BACI|nr:heptaprenyl diphosphate synthase component 1 [Salibacterium halotolerans]SFP41413.1 Heptaprenyl diphosphate synthase (HEPPP synthase) subunit 1 [Salibacterium halotolerans]
MKELYENAEVQKIEQEFRQLTSHPYLNEYIEEAGIEYDYILFMMELLSDSSLSADTEREQILSALLVQAAFVTHEKVETGGKDAFHDKKPRQLTVLAGDFFSSLYHSMLDREVHASVIPVFSEAIQKINEEKMSLHFRENESEDVLLSRLALVEGCFLKKIGSFYKKPETGSLAETFFLLKRLVHERKPQENCYLSAPAGSIHAFLEGGSREWSGAWPTDNIEQWLTFHIKRLQKELHQKLHTTTSVGNKLLYNVLKTWSHDFIKAEMK